MTIKRAKILDAVAVDRSKAAIENRSSTPTRDRAILALSHKAGLRAGEIAELHAEDILDARGRLKDSIWVSGRGAKYGKARTVPCHPELRAALAEVLVDHPTRSGPLFIDRFGKGISANATAQLLLRLYQRADLQGCSSHSGRRTFITGAAREAAKVGCSMRDVQVIAGHADLRVTMIYMEPTSNHRALVARI